MDIKNKKITKARRQREKEMFKMLAAKKMNEMELNKVAGAGLDTINYILRHQNNKAQARVDLPGDPWFPHPGPHQFPKTGPCFPKGPEQ